MNNSIKKFRLNKGWTQQRLADELGMSLDYVKKVETGRCTPSVKAARKMALLFGCETIDEILKAS